MKTFTLTFALILILSLVFITDANEQRSNNALLQQLLDYLEENKRQELLYNQRKGLEKQLQRYREKLYDDDESNDSDEYKSTNVRRKSVGLDDNPYK